jgi:hypothetical protein
MILGHTNEQINSYKTTILQQIEGLQRTYIANFLKEAEDSELRSPNGMLNYACGHSPPGHPTMSQSKSSISFHTGSYTQLCQEFGYNSM